MKKAITKDKNLNDNKASVTFFLRSKKPKNHNCGKTFGRIITILIVIAIFLTHINSLVCALAENIIPDNNDVVVDGIQNNGVVRPSSINEGLSRKSFADMEGRRVTLREPVMKVLDRSIERTEADVLSDIFPFIDPDTQKPYVGEGADLAQIDFSKAGNVNKIEENVLGSLTNPRYPMMGLEKGEHKYFSDFVKYMLLRQAWYYRTQAMEDIKNGELKKHPAADYIYGHIDETAKAVDKLIISDPIYRSPITTGLYLVPGEVATVTVKGLKEGQTIRLTTHQQDSLGYDGGFSDGFNPNTDASYNGLSSTEKYFRYWDLKLIEEAKKAAQEERDPDYTQFNFNLQGQWRWQNQKVPCMGSIFEISSDGTYQIGSIYGGPLYLQPTDSAVEIEISGAVETPHFILGVTTKEEFEESLRKAPGLIATLDVENGQLIGLSQYMKECDDIEKLAYFWHSVFAINSSLNGRAYNYNVTMAYDIHVPAGEAVALNSSFAAQPYGWFKSCMNYEELTTKGNWGTFHELGHIQAKTYGVNWGMCNSTCKESCEGEVWNNTLIVLMYAMLCNMDSRMINVEHGEFVHPYTAVERSTKVQKVNDYHEFNSTKGAHFDQLSLYATLIHSFGPERFIDFFYTYNLNPTYCKESRADFIYRIALVDHVNIFNWINENYHGNVLKSHFTNEQWRYLQTLPTFYPIAYRYANGIDGNETARKYEIDGKYQTIFDLSGDNIICPEKFQILDVTNPLYGSILYDKENCSVTYNPPKQITESDRFDIIVKTESGRIVSLNVNFNLLYRGTAIEVWSLRNDVESKQSVEAALAEIKDQRPLRTEESSIAGKARFTADSTQREYYHLRFKFIATTSGVHEFYLKADDASRVTFYQDDENGQELGVLSTAKDVSNYGSSNVRVSLDVGDTIYVDCHLVNWGGPGNLYVGVKFPNESTIIDIPSTNIINALVNSDELKIADEFEGWQPKFLDSIKDQSIDYKVDETSWEILAYPNPDLLDGGSVPALVDGNDNTFFHSYYHGSGSKTEYPHVFLIDCHDEIVANYFEIYRRGNSNDQIKRFALYACGDLANEEGPTDDDFKLLFDGTTTKSTDLKYRVTFDEQNIRYFKLVIKETAGFTVIKELYAGRMVSLEQTVKPKNYEKNNEGFVENKANGKLTTQTNGALYEFEFLGTGFDLFADTNPEYGTATIYLDNVEIGTINLADKIIFNKCVYRKNDLEMAKHIVKIVTNSTAQFNISFINVTYATPVDENDYPAIGDDYGDKLPLVFSPDWRTIINNYADLTSIKFVKEVPDGYVDTYIRINDYIRVYHKLNDDLQIAFVYQGDIISPLDCGFLFAGCTSLKEIIFENFDTSSMHNATSMFSECLDLEQLDLSSFNTEQTLFMSTMFQNCQTLSELNLGGFAIKEGSTLIDFLNGCTSLSKLYVPQEFRIDNITLPYRFIDLQTNQLSYEITQENIGHIMLLHENHLFNKKIDEIEAGCEVEGTKAYYLCDCGAYSFDGVNETTESLVIPAKGHLFNKKIDEIEAGCEVEGTKAHYLCDCGAYSFDGVNETTESLVIPAKGHLWGEWKVVKEPTNKEEGLKERKCENGHVETEIIPKLNESSHSGGHKAIIIIAVIVSALIVISVPTLIIIKKKRSS